MYLTINIAGHSFVHFIHSFVRSFLSFVHFIRSFRSDVGSSDLDNLLGGGIETGSLTGEQYSLPIHAVHIKR